MVPIRSKLWTRTVRRDGTVRLGNRLYEVDLSLRTLTVKFRFDPSSFRFSCIQRISWFVR